MFIPLKDLNPSRTYPFVNVTLILANITVFIYELGLEATSRAGPMKPALVVLHGSRSFSCFPVGHASFEVSSRRW